MSKSESQKLFYPGMMALSAGLMSTTFRQFSFAHFILISLGTMVGYYTASLRPSIHFSTKKIKLGHNKRLYFILCALLIVVFTIKPLHRVAMVQYSFASFLCAGYFTHFVLKSGTLYGVRSVFIVKNVVLALAWALVTSPFQTHISYSYLLFTQRFLYILALSISIDMRDMKKDHLTQLITLPLRYGIQMTKTIAVILIVSSFAFTLSFTSHHPESSIHIAAAISGLLSILSILLLNEESNKSHYLLYIDGNLLLHGLLFFIFA